LTESNSDAAAIETKPFGRLPPVPASRKDRKRRVAFAVLVALLLVLIALLALPIYTATDISEQVHQYSTTASEDSPGGVEISPSFFSTCSGANYPLTLVGNQTFWLTWSSANGLPVNDVRLVGFSPYPPTGYLNDTYENSGGYAQTSSATLAWTCNGDLALLVNSNASTLVEIQAGLVYDYTSHVPIF
jgi:hypothetical protein